MLFDGSQRLLLRTINTDYFIVFDSFYILTC